MGALKYTVYDRLIQREVGQQRKKYADIRGIYGDRRWVADLDIVDELEGHTGCVNALSWSSSGRLLASGSDDNRVNIHSYHPESSTSHFSLTTSILTGHRANIFSVKFMPYSNDRTLVSATDDVRIFDIEHSGHSALGSARTSGRTPRSVGMKVDAVTLTQGDTNARVFRSHFDTVKRIVTEDTPFYFLTCSNDGDVRQWDVRQPAKAYPRAKDNMLPQWARDNDGTSESVPPPLISYRRHGLDLNTISCSPSQPHYIALGGAHLHCFLHDRRMLGRDRAAERGSKSPISGSSTARDDLLLGNATQCVKKFAPDGKKSMRRNDSGHITACKISDAHPNELLVSWSQDHIYSFDMLRAPDAREEVIIPKMAEGSSKSHVKDSSRKRKLHKPASASREAAERAGSRPRTDSPDEDLTLRVRYENGQTEDIRIEPTVEQRMTQEELNELRATDHFRIAKTTVMMSKRMFNLGEHGNNGLKLAFTSILGYSDSILSDMDEISRSWGYPVDPNPVDVALQNKLRDSRAASRRFVQAAGTLSRVMGGQLLTGANSDALIAQHFASIQHAPRERDLPQHEQFGYDFLKAILLWLDSGPSAVVEGFSSRSPSTRCPCPQDSDMDAIDDIIIPYLLDLASDESIVNVDASRFEMDDTRILFQNESAAVLAFAQAIKIPFADLTGAVAPASGDRSARYDTQDRNTARMRWAFVVGRGVLRNAAKDIRFGFVDRAFGGRGIADKSIRLVEQTMSEQNEEIDLDVENVRVTEAELVQTPWIESGEEGALSISGPSASAIDALDLTTAESDTDINDVEDDQEMDDEDEDEGDDAASDRDSASDSDSDSDQELHRTDSGRMLWRSEFGRTRLRRERVARHVPCAPHTRVYRGHCNVKTVKDVNYFGLMDDYVVSGSDDGNLFIWDRKTAQLVNILEGDGEVVNVVQGHPYEPTLAVSGIDHTIKIFSPNTRDQYNARKGIGVRSADSGGFSSLGWGRRRRTPSEPTTHTNQSNADLEDRADSDSDEDSDPEPAANGLRSRKRMHDSYQIMSQNDLERKDGREDYFISRTVFAQLARHIAAQQADQREDGEEDGDGRPMVITEDNCDVM